MDKKIDKKRANELRFRTLLAESLTDAQQQVADESPYSRKVNHDANLSRMGVPKKGVTVAKATTARKALDLAAKHAPDAWNAAQQYFGKQNKDVDVLAESPNSAVQSAVVTSLLKNGLSAKLFEEQAQLTEQEAKAYSRLIDSFKTAQTRRVDAGQARPNSTGDQYIDRLTLNMEIEEIIVGLGISSDFYAKIVRGVNSHTSADVELFQLDRRVRGQRFM
jgi:uncharacterized protein (DUF885 family)